MTKPRPCADTDGAPEAVRRNREEIVNAKAGDLEEKLSAMQSFREAAVRATNVAVGILQRTPGSLRRQINRKIQELFSGAQNTAEQSKDYEVEYTDPSTLRKVASFLTLGLVSAERTSKTVQTVDSTKIRSALEGFQVSFSTQITTLVDNTRQGLRKKIEAGILAALREHKVVSDRDIDTTRLAQASRSALAMVRDFDDPELPSLPSNLMQNGTLKAVTPAVTKALPRNI